jgi:hypothetical protein
MILSVSAKQMLISNIWTSCTVSSTRYNVYYAKAILGWRIWNYFYHHRPTFKTDFLLIINLLSKLQKRKLEEYIIY